MKMISDLIKKVKAGLSAVAGSDDFLVSALLPLVVLSEDIYHQAVNYVKTGADSEVLLALMNRSDDKAWSLMGRDMGTISWNYTSVRLSKDEEALTDKAYQARKALYADLYSQLIPEQAMRLGKLIYAIQQGKAEMPKSDVVPDWFWVLVSDALKITLKSHYNTETDERKKWHIDSLLHTLQADDKVKNPVATLITAMFERRGISDYYHESLFLLYRMAGAKAFLQAHRDEVMRVIPDLSASGQQLFLDHFLTYAPDTLNDFAQVVVMLSGSNSKRTRELASSKFSEIDAAVLHDYLSAMINTEDGKQRAFIASMLARLGERARETLSHALANEKNKSVAISIEQALARLDSVDMAGDNDALVTAPMVAVPESTLPEDTITLLRQNYYDILADNKKRADAEIAANQHPDKRHKSNWAQQRYKNWRKLESSLDKDLERVLARLNGAANSVDSDYLEMITYKKRLMALPEFGLYQLMRLSRGGDYIWYSILPYAGKLFDRIELRQLAAVAQACGLKNAVRSIGEQYLIDYYGSSDLQCMIYRDEQILPFFYDHPEFIEEALGLRPPKQVNRWRRLDAGRALALLKRYHTVPKSVVAKLLELALGDQKHLRLEAQEVLAKLPNVHERAIEALGSGKQEIRISACQWLMRLGHKDAIAPLYALLKKEKKEVVIAAALTTLESLGEDISRYLSPETLLSDAKKGLKAKPPASLAWFDYATLPSLRWKNGEMVDADIIRWWVVLAEKLKEPAPNALLVRYLGLLDEKSAHTFSLHILQQFIHQDTRTMDIDEASQKAKAEAPQRYAQHQQWFKQWPHEYYQKLAAKSIEEVAEDIKKEYLGVYLGSAIKSKGLLALTCAARGVSAVQFIQDYLKNHYTRTHQVKALLTALAYNDDPVAIQQLLSVSRRYRTAGVQALAKSLVHDVAERHGWSQDELADRTIPTAGFDDDGMLMIDYGSRRLSVLIDDQDKFVLKNEEGKVLKSLPAPRQTDDAATIKEAKSLFSTAKKEYKQVLTMQTARLYEAMCGERLWSVADWMTYLYQHPLMKRLISRLVWLEVDSNHHVLQTFRPSTDGALLNLEDDEIALDAGSYVKLAHRVLLDATTADAWLAHFKDYKLDFLFPQMVNELPNYAADAESFADKKGYLTDTFTLRGVVTKMGYQRANIEDGASFDRYYKPYDALGLSASIIFSGSYVPEENIPAVILEMVFEKDRASTWGDAFLKLASIPQVLLAESYADYVKLANASQGFDPEWESKGLW